MSNIRKVRSNVGVLFSKKARPNESWFLTIVHLSLHPAFVNSSPWEELNSFGASEDFTDDQSVATRDEERNAADLALAEPDVDLALAEPDVDLAADVDGASLYLQVDNSEAMMFNKYLHFSITK